jgi:hypothetical protein
MQRIEKDNVIEHLPSTTTPTCGSGKTSLENPSTIRCVCPSGKILNNNAVPEVPGTATVARIPGKAADKWWCTSS